MIIWRGKGILILLTTVACIWAMDFLTGQWSGNEHYYATHGWTVAVAYLAAAAAVYGMRGWLGVGMKRVLVDPATHQEVVLNQESSLFFVPARYWPPVLAVTGRGARRPFPAVLHRGRQARPTPGAAIQGASRRQLGSRNPRGTPRHCSPHPGSARCRGPPGNDRRRRRAR